MTTGTAARPQSSRQRHESQQRAAGKFALNY